MSAIELRLHYAGYRQAARKPCLVCRMAPHGFAQVSRPCRSAMPQLSSSVHRTLRLRVSCVRDTGLCTSGSLCRCIGDESLFAPGY